MCHHMPLEVVQGVPCAQGRVVASTELDIAAHLSENVTRAEVEVTMEAMGMLEASLDPSRGMLEASLDPSSPQMHSGCTSYVP